MPRPLARRVARLERGPGRGCPDCGGGGGEVVFEVVVPEAVGLINARQEPPEPRKCPRCGRQTEYRVVMPSARA